VTPVLVETTDILRTKNACFPLISATLKRDATPDAVETDVMIVIEEFMVEDYLIQICIRVRIFAKISS
jgi:hypothetical protein